MAQQYPRSSVLPDDQVLFAQVNATVDGDNTLVAAVAGKRIRVLSYMITVTAAASGHIIKSSGGTVLARAALAANGGISHAAANGCFETAAGEGLVVTNQTGVDSLGHLSYVLLS